MRARKLRKNPSHVDYIYYVFVYVYVYTKNSSHSVDNKTL